MVHHQALYMRQVCLSSWGWRPAVNCKLSRQHLASNLSLFHYCSPLPSSLSSPHQLPVAPASPPLTSQAFYTQFRASSPPTHATYPCKLLGGLPPKHTLSGSSSGEHASEYMRGGSAGRASSSAPSGGRQEGNSRSRSRSVGLPSRISCNERNERGMFGGKDAE